MARTKSPLYINENPSIYTQRQETDGYIREWQSGSFRCQRFKNLYRPRRQGEAHRLFSPPRIERRLVGPIQPGCLVPFFALGRFYIIGGESPSVYAAFQYQLAVYETSVSYKPISGPERVRDIRHSQFYPILDQETFVRNSVFVPEATCDRAFTYMVVVAPAVNTPIIVPVCLAPAAPAASFISS